MNERTFAYQISKARMSQAVNDNPDYWMGYERGLKRQYFGKDFGTQEEHLEWLLADGSEYQRQHSRGYRAGLLVE